MILATKAAAAHTAAEFYLWVMGDYSGNIKTSDSLAADVWTSRTSSFGSSDIESIASNGNRLFVAVGQSGKLATSTDGITWTQQTSSFSTSRIRGVAYGLDGNWVAVGDSGKLATSTDGITWTQQTSGTAQTLNAVAYGDGLWVFGGSSILRTATDPTSTWTTRTSTLGVVNRNMLYYWPEQAIWIAGNDTGSTGALASSTDGITWTARNLPFTANSYNGGFTSNSSVAVIGITTDTAPTCDIASTINGTTWTNRTPASTGETIYSAASDNYGLMIVNGSTLQTSTNGTSWTDVGVVLGVGVALCHSTGVPAIR